MNLQSDNDSQKILYNCKKIRRSVSYFTPSSVTFQTESMSGVLQIQSGKGLDTLLAEAFPIFMQSARKGNRIKMI